jgi:hypothetical protein
MQHAHVTHIHAAWQCGKDVGVQQGHGHAVSHKYRRHLRETRTQKLDGPLVIFSPIVFTAIAIEITEV